MPDAGAVARSLIAVLVVAVAGLYLVGATGAMAATGAAAIAGATALQDSPHGRVPLVIGVSLVGGAAVFLGAATVEHWAIFTAVVTIWCFWAGMAWAAGSNSGLIAAAATVLIVVARPEAGGWLPAAAAAGLAVLGGLAQAALIGWWPRRRWRAQRAALAAAYESLAHDAHGLTRDPERRVAREPLQALRATFLPADGRSLRRPLAYRAWYGLPERIAVTLSAVSDTRRADAGRPDTDLTGLLTAAGDALAATAWPTRSNARLVRAALERVDAAVGDVDDAARGVAQRLAAQLHDAATLRFGEAVPRPGGASEVRQNSWSDFVARTVTQVHQQLRNGSPVLRHAVRLALATGCGVAIARVAEVAHGLWIPLAVVMALRPETAHTYTRCLGRVAGMVLGVVLATTVTVVLDPSGPVGAVLGVAVLGLAYVVSTRGYVAASASLAAAIVFLLDIPGGTGIVAMGDRVLATLIGGVLAVLAHVVLPDRASVRLRLRAGELLKAEIDYAAAVIRASVHDVDRPDELLAASWDRAFRARAAFEEAAATGLMDDTALRRWLSSYRAGLNAVTASCAALEANLPARRSAPTTAALVSAVDELVEALRGDPQTPGSAWTLNVDALSAASARVRGELARFDDASTRVLLTEIDTVAERLVEVASAIPG